MSRYVALPFVAVMLTGLSTAAFAQSCTSDIATFQKLLDSDVRVGHVARSVHDKAIQDLAHANELCKSGQNAEASAAVTATRKRYGYPTNL